MIVPKSRALALASVLVLAGCSRRGTGPGGAAPADRGVVSLESAATRSGPSRTAPASVTLTRGKAVRIVETRGEFLRVALEEGGEVWVSSGAVERLSERAAREKRTSAVAGFAAPRGRAVETCPVLLAPDYGAAHWGTLEDGDDVDVILADHDFYGVRLPGQTLAFVPARSIRLLAPPAGTLPRSSPSAAGSRGPILGITPLGPEPPPGRFPERGAGGAQPAPSARGGDALSSLPAGAEAPVLITRVDARYPEVARRMRLSGDVVLRVIVEANGTIGRIDVMSSGPAGMTDAAIDAVRSWVYRPARVEGRPVAVWKVVRVRFSLTASREPPFD